MLKKLLLPIFLVCSTANAESKSYSEWDTQDKIQFNTYTALTIIDYKQTSWALKQKDDEGNFIYHESNPFLGNRPSDAKLATVQLASVAMMYYDTKHNGEKHRKLRWVLIAIKAATVLHNNNIGVTIGKSW